MRFVKPKIGLVDYGVFLGLVALTVAEVVAILGGLGAIFAVVALGYFLVFGFIYWMYRKTKSA